MWQRPWPTAEKERLIEQMIFGESLNCWGVEHMKKEQSRMTGEGVVCREESIEDLEDNIEDDLIIDLELDLGPV